MVAPIVGKFSPDAMHGTHTELVSSLLSDAERGALLTPTTVAGSRSVVA